MRRPSCCCFLLAGIVQLCCMVYRCHGDPPPLAAAERVALVAFYRATNGESWNASIIGRTQMWDVTNSTSNYCGWYGVSCCCYNATLMASYGSVIQLALSGVGLIGSLPSSLSALTFLQRLHLPFNRIQGTLPPELSQLTSLTVFNLTKNELQGTLPPEYAAWSGMVRFDVSQNEMNGTLPPQYANWTTHNYFAVDSNEFTGMFPSEYSTWGDQLSVFSTRSNKFTSTLPPQYSSWVNVFIFQVDNTPLTGTLPASYGAWKAITYVILSNTNITGSIPDSWGSWSTVASLQLYMNKLTGTLPASFGNLSSVTSLGLAINNFTGTVPVVAWSKLRGVESIILQDNPFLSGDIPKSWNNVFAAAGGLPPIVAICRTNICAPELPALQWLGYVLGYACLNQSAFPLLLTIKAENVVELLADASFSTSVPCVTTAPAAQSPPAVATLTKTIDWKQPASFASNTAWQSLIEQAVSHTSVVVSTFAIAAGATGAASAGDLQMLAAVLTSPCMCGSIASTSQSMAYTTSPFADFGVAVVVVGNVGIVLVVGVFVRLLLFTLVRRRLQKRPQADIDTERALVAATLRYPSLTVRLALFLSAGIAKAAVSIVATIDERSTAQIASAFLGFGFLISLSAFAEVVLHRGRVLQVPLLYQEYCLERDYAPVPPAFSRVFLPRGHWSPDLSRRQFGAMVSGLRGGSKHLWFVLALVNLFLQMTFASPAASNRSCDAIHALGVLVPFSAAIFWLAYCPTRAPISTIMSAGSLMFVALTSLFSALCEHEFISSSAVLNVGLSGSIFGIISTATTLLVSLSEQYLTKRRLINRNKTTTKRMQNVLDCLPFYSHPLFTEFPTEQRPSSHARQRGSDLSFKMNSEVRISSSERGRLKSMHLFDYDDVPCHTTLRKSRTASSIPSPTVMRCEEPVRRSAEQNLEHLVQAVCLQRLKQLLHQK